MKDSILNNDEKDITNIPFIESTSLDKIVTGVQTELPSVQTELPSVQDDDASSSSDPSGNIIDASGNKIKKTYRKYSYKEIEKEILNNYFDQKSAYSSALDILATYLRGQKLVYMESKSYCEKQSARTPVPLERGTPPHRDTLTRRAA